MSDFTFMRSGFNLTQPNDEEFEKNTATIIVTYAQYAIKTAGTYVSHHKTRNGVTPEDIKRAMMLEMFLFNNRPNVLEKAEEIRQTLFNEEEYDSDEEEELVNLNHGDEFSENECQCAICKCINGIYERWESWTPVSLFETTIKKHIDKI